MGVFLRLFSSWTRETRERESERESERHFRRGVHRQYSAPSSYVDVNTTEFAADLKN